MTQGSRGSTVVTEVTEGVSPLRRELWLLVLSTKELPGDQAPLSSEEEAGKQVPSGAVVTGLLGLGDRLPMGWTELKRSLDLILVFNLTQKYTS